MASKRPRVACPNLTGVSLLGTFAGCTGRDCRLHLMPHMVQGDSNSRDFIRARANRLVTVACAARLERVAELDR
jgi:hypothetical protein